MTPRILLATLAGALLTPESSTARDDSRHRLPDRWAQSGVLFEGTAGHATRGRTDCQVIIAEARDDGYLRLLVTSPKWSFIGYVYEGRREYELDQRGRPFLRFKRVAPMPLTDPAASLKRVEQGTWRTLLTLNHYNQSELRFRWEAGKGDRPGVWIGELFAATDYYELPDTGYRVRVSPVSIIEDPLDASLFKEAWAGAVDGTHYEGKWFNATSRSSPVTVEFGPLEESANAASMTIENFDSRAAYRGRFEITDATANGYALTMSMHEVLARERDRRVGRIVGGNPRAPIKHAASRSIKLAFRLSIDRETLYGAGHGGDLLVLRPATPRATRSGPQAKKPPRRDLTPEEQGARDLKLARMYLRSAKPHSREIGYERLRALVEQLPDTPAAETARSLLAER